jgi:aminoglycoside phosphotransferase (APT) family kinase protein
MSTALNDFDGLLRWPALNEWIAQQDVPGTGPVTAVEPLAGGSQNHLYLMSRGNERFVLRRPPRHLRANSNETMLREARVLKAIAGSKVPHPQLYAACADLDVIGTCFYLMQPLEGFTPMSGLTDKYVTERSWRAEMGPEFVRACAALAAIDPNAVGLADFGKSEGWHQRQVGRWRSQLEGYRALEGYEGSSLPYVEDVGRWLGDHLPKHGRIGIIHGDLQFANVMFSHLAPRITGLIDWELSSLGDPLLDLAWVMQTWYDEANDPPGRGPIVKPWDGFVPRSELVSLYGELTGRGMDEVHWFFVLACYKLGCILEGTYARAKAGQAPMETGVRLHEYSMWLLTKAKQLTVS